MTNRNDIITRTLNLRELAASTDSQSEAMAAMKVAERLMRSYRIEEAELALAEGSGKVQIDIVDKRSDRHAIQNGRMRHKVQSCLWAIGSYCEVEVTVRNSAGREGSYRVIGDRPDVELFEYLVAFVRDSMDRSYAKWKRGQQGVGRGAKASYQLAFAQEVSKTLSQMGRDRAAEREAALKEEAKLLNRPADEVRVAVNSGDSEMLTSTALVLLSAVEEKRKAVKDAYRAAYKNTRLGTASGFNYRGGTSAASAGRAAGAALNLSRPVGGSSSARISA